MKLNKLVIIFSLIIFGFLGLLLFLFNNEKVIFVSKPVNNISIKISKIRDIELEHHIYYSVYRNKKKISDHWFLFGLLDKKLPIEFESEYFNGVLAVFEKGKKEYLILCDINNLTTYPKGDSKLSIEENEIKEKEMFVRFAKVDPNFNILEYEIKEKEKIEKAEKFIEELTEEIIKRLD